jgi:PAS domain S-box-containing protein
MGDHSCNPSYFQLLFEFLPDNAFVVEVLPGPRFRIVDANPAQVKELNFSVEDIRGKFIEEILPEPLSAKTISHYNKCIEAGKSISYEEEAVLPQGCQHFTTTLFPVKDAAGHIFQIIGVSKNISWQRKAENEFKAQNERFAELNNRLVEKNEEYENLAKELQSSNNSLKELNQILKQSNEVFDLFMKYSPIYVFFKDKDIRPITLSHNYEKMLGIPVEKAIGKTMFELFPSELAKSMVEDDKKILAEGKVVEVIEELNGRTYSTTKFPIHKEGKPEMLAGFTIDITETRQMMSQLAEAKEKAEESDRLKSAFLANMSHEIRTPLNAIMGFAELLHSEKDLSPEQRDEYAHIVKQRGIDLMNIINDILDISRLEAGEMKINENEVNLDDLLTEIYISFGDQNKYIFNKPVKFFYQVELPTDKKVIYTDAMRLRQIITNLISNAIKFTPKGSIEFGCKLQQKGDLLFYVKDSGIGISQDKFDLIFDRFRQVDDKKLTQPHGGTGLGLSICKALLQLMGGSIWLTSESGVGTTFYFTLPEKFAAIKESVQPLKTGLKYDWADKTFLIVEDDFFNSEYINALLTKTKARTVIAATGQEALDKYKELKKVDVILMDIQLPDINGYEIARQIRAQDPQSVIIAQTAYATEADKQRCTETGFNATIFKPVSVDEFLSTISLFLR